MRYEQTPRPWIEEHYHIRDLIEGQEKRTADRNYHRNVAKEREERLEEIRIAPWKQLTEFWCKSCKEDFKAETIKETENDWNDSTQVNAFYRTKHFCGKWCIRYITDKIKDPYWLQSRVVATDRAKYYKEIIQPFETGYNLLYGKQ